MHALLLAVCLSSPTPASLLEGSLAAMGGADKIGSLVTVKATRYSHDYLVEQSERPTGPFITTYSTGEETVDLATNSFAADRTLNGFVYGDRQVKSTTAFGEGKIQKPGVVPEYQIRVRLALGPERVLFTALKAKDAHYEGEGNLQDVPHHKLTFHWGKVPVRLWLNKGTLLPTAVETEEEGRGFYTIWGDVVERTVYGNWEYRSGILYPTHWIRQVNDWTVNESTFFKLELAFGERHIHEIEPAANPAFATGPIVNAYKKAELAPDFYQYTGAFNFAVLERNDGLVVIESVFTPQFASAILDRLAIDFPGKKVVLVVSTSDAWPHFGGMRTFVARGAEVVALKRNQPILQKYVAASHKLNPDELQKQKTKPKWRWIDKATTIGAGKDQFIVAPVDGEGSERMLMIYFPAHGVLYGSDLIQQDRTGALFAPGYAVELARAVQKQGWQPKNVFAMHAPLRPWQWLLDELAKVK